MIKKKLIAILCMTTMVTTLFVGCGINGNSGVSSSKDIDFESAMNDGEESYVFEETETYKNHIEIEGQWGPNKKLGGGDGGIGDPFVMRHDGKYYLYPSSSRNDDANAIKVFESEDLVNWTYRGEAATGEDVWGSYAPEVVYYNGTFYMIQAGQGDGHCILASDSPTGPFKRITEYFGRGIDGAFYVGDDGQLYIMSANNGLQIAKLDTETMLPGSGNALSGYLNGWTEGPGIFRRGDILYLTYAGNHVSSKGYRVGYSYCMGEDPMGTFVMPQNNILLLKVGEDYFHGLGHSSNVIGPNLDARYTAYHNLINFMGAQRRLMIDQLVTNGAMLLANGPTYSEVAVPERPDFETRDVKDGFTSEESTEEIYTIEYNVTPTKTSVMDFMFSYKDAKNYTTVRWSMTDETIALITVKDGAENEVQSAKVEGITASKLHTIRVEKGADKVEVYLDTMQKINASAKGISAGSIGVKGDATYSYTAFTNDAYGTSDFDSIKNVPSAFPAVHYLKGENRGWSIKNAVVTEGGIRQNEAENTVKNETDAISALVMDTANDWVKYAINATEESYYGLSGTVTGDSAGSKIQVIIDEKDIYTFTVAETGYADEEYANIMLGQFALSKGQHTLKIRLCSGKLQVQTFEMQPTNPSEITYENTMAEMNDRGWNYIGNWKTIDGAHISNAGDSTFAFAGDDKVTDFSMEVDIALLEEDSMYDGGIIFHAKNYSSYSAQVEESYQGYYLSIRRDQISISRYNYGEELLDLASADLLKDEYHKFKVEMRNNHIRVWLDDMDTPIIDFYDSNAFLSGQVGFCSDQLGIAFKNVKIETYVD